jgi:hypothetical protein
MSAIQSDNPGFGTLRTACPRCLGGGFLSAAGDFPPTSGAAGTRVCGLCLGSGQIEKRDGRPENEDLEKLNGVAPSDRRKENDKTKQTEMTTRNKRQAESISRRAAERAEFARQADRQAAILDEFSEANARQIARAREIRRTVFAILDREAMAKLIADKRAADPRARVKLDSQREALSNAIAGRSRASTSPPTKPVKLCPTCRGEGVVPGATYTDQAEQKCGTCKGNGWVFLSGEAIGPRE